MRSVFLERVLPYLLAVAATLYILVQSLPFQMRMEKDLGNAVLTVVSIIIAIAATSLTISLSLPSGIRYLKDEHPDQYKYFIDYHIEVITMGVISSILSLFAIMMSPLSLEHMPLKIGLPHRLIFVFWSFSFVSVIIIFFRLTILLRRILVELI